MDIMSYFFSFISVVSCIYIYIYNKGDERSKNLKLEDIKLRYFIMGMYMMFIIILNIL